MSNKLFQVDMGLPITQYNKQGGVYTIRVFTATKEKAIEQALDIWYWPEYDQNYNPTFVNAKEVKMAPEELL